MTYKYTEYALAYIDSSPGYVARPQYSTTTVANRPDQQVGLTTISRESLYDLVWNEPVRTIAQRTSASDMWLKKCCAKAGVPAGVPPRLQR